MGEAYMSDVEVGQSFKNRKEIVEAGLHTYRQHGISGDGRSIVLSSGYVDDVDLGDLIIYTGEGGRDANTGRQIKDQELKRGNLKLAEKSIQGYPVHVIRGDKLKSIYAPKIGYRYDGMYRIESYWSEVGKDGYNIWRYRVIRCENQKHDVLPEDENSGIDGGRPRYTVGSISRLIRDTKVGRRIKEMYDYSCQICGCRIDTPAGPYAECCHIRPLGMPHNGDDSLENVLCLCPNCHVRFDYHALHVADDLTVIETGNKLTVDDRHSIAIENLRYKRGLG